ncbi:hypothetical protein [Thermosporothrix hazakensis]|uniref:hypothetical protein n=1 Tax=Thermosporothrix hazakensis TaxID=644383 RepID=UPI0011B7FC88|nr:hypothetical protein [Thermosporothrix hazakensis]
MAGLEKKTVRAAEQKEAERAALRKQTAHLQSADLVFVDEAGSHLAMPPCIATLSTRSTCLREGASQLWSHHDHDRLDIADRHGASIPAG